jgi:hypothetical protein
MKPEFVDNRGGNTLAAAINGFLHHLGKTRVQRGELSIASGYFDPAGFAILADEVERLPKVRLLIGAQPSGVPKRPRFLPGEVRGDQYEHEQVANALQAHAAGLASDRDLLGFSPHVDREVKRLLAFLASGRIEVRRYEKTFLHGKAFIFATDDGVLAGSSNFTAAGLTRNLELNLGRYDVTPVRQVKDWFDSLWGEAQPFDLAAVYAARYEEYAPYLLFLRVLWERYGDEVQQEFRDGTIQLTGFQKDGLARAKRLLNDRNGVIFADGVGLGKTFIGGDLIREYVQQRRQRALLIAPAALRDGTWARFIAKHQLYVECHSFEQLTADPQLGGPGPGCLRAKKDEYSLIVVDEAHTFRNPDTDRARALRRLLEGSPPKKLVLMSATPVNNSLWDLYYLLNYFVGHDAAFAAVGIRSLRGRFADAMAEDPYDLRPDMLFDVLDATCVRRTRHFVKRFYPFDTVKGPDGKTVPITFPQPKVRRLTYDFNASLPGLLTDFADALAPEEGEPKLTMARYAPSLFLLRPTEEERAAAARERALVGLLRSALLKRLESSSYSFAKTLRRMMESHDRFLKALDLGFVPTPEALDEWSSMDSDEDFEAALREHGSEPANGFDAVLLRVAVEEDKRHLERFAKAAEKVTRAKDPKLAELHKELARIAREATREGRTEEEQRDKRKVLIFSYFEDTLDWIEEYLRDAIAVDPALAAYRGRMAVVGGRGSHGGVSRADAIFGFAPRTAEAPPGRDQDRFDVLLATDVLAEGQNLQQSRHVINYDLPWNPMRLVQRHGRIDRIGSPHTEVFIGCFFPDRDLDTLLGLEERIRRKLAQAAASIGVESEVIPQGAVNEVVFGETREQIEALRAEDPSLFETAGEDPNAHSGEEYRQELKLGMQRWGDRVRSLPWSVGSGFRRGTSRGWFFCARIGDQQFLRFLPADGGDPIRDTLKCLRQVSCDDETRRDVDHVLLRDIYGAWERARDDIYQEWSEATDPAKLQPKVRPLFKQVAEHLRRHPPLDVSQLDVDAAIDAVEAPWGIRHERQLRAVFEAEGQSPGEKSLLIYAKIREMGLQPFRAPEPLAPIEKEDVSLVCWLVLS